jgi:hypothetical protein
VNPFGLGAFVEPTSDKAEKIYCSEGMTQIESFSSVKMQLSKRDRRSSSKIGVKEVKTFLKWEVKQLPISCLSEHQAPYGNFRKSNAFLILLIIVEVWKNFVFKSLQVNHVSLNLFLQRDSS